jgi:hypothetical protein
MALGERDHIDPLSAGLSGVAGALSTRIQAPAGKDRVVQLPRLRTPEERARLWAKADAQAKARYEGLSSKRRSESPMAGAAISLEDGTIMVTEPGTAPLLVDPRMSRAADRIGGLGQVTACGNTVGGCLEFHGANQQLLRGTNPSNIDFITPFRPRGFEPKPVCPNCGTMFDQSQFPDGTQFDPPLLPFRPPQ